MPPRLAIPVEVYLAKTLGQPLFKAFAEAELSGEGALAMAMGIFAERIDDAGLLRAMQSVFRFVGIQGEAIRICEESDTGGIDERFQGRNLELWQVFIKALQVNFADFFGGSPLTSTLFAKLKGLITQSRQMSTSTSGDPVSANQSSAETFATSKTAPIP
jgi:hypothetical protein